MKTIAIKSHDGKLEVNYSKNSNKPPFRTYVITYNSNLSIGDNLENIKSAITGLSVDAAIIDNSLNYTFSDAIIGINHQKIDVGLAITNMLNIPVVNENRINEIGLQQAVDEKTEYLKWHLDYYGQYAGKRNYGQEAMLTIGNGFFGLRGAYVESHADQDNYPGMYIAGVFNQLTTNINGRDVVNEDLVNLPNSQFITFGVDHQTPFSVAKEDVQDTYRSLDLKNGVLTTAMNIQLSTGHILEVKATKVANMTNWHRYSIRYEVKPINFSGNLQIYSEIDGSVINGNVERYQDFDQHHLDITNMSAENNQMSLSGQTKTSHVKFAINTNLTSSNLDLDDKIISSTEDQKVKQVLNIEVKEGQVYQFDKNVVIFTSREDRGDLEHDSQVELTKSSFDDTKKDSVNFWKNIWDTSDIQIGNDITSQKLTRVNIYHLFVTGAALREDNLDASVGARGLHGEAYRGHIFWDNMFALPYYTLHYPKITKQAILYRYNRLDAARKYAQSDGRQGSMFPWQSGMYGDEQSQFVHLNPVNNSWDPDNSRLQRHVSISVAFNVLSYFHLTNDQDFMNQYGLEILLSISKFWESLAEFNEDTGRYDIKHVMGPDEFHEHYPNSDERGLVNNAYTNMMVSWLFVKVAELIKKVDKSVLQQAAQKADFTKDTLEKMDDISKKLTLDINEDGIIGQFQGYFKLSKLNFDAYRKKYGDISRIDRILKGEGKSPDAYQVAKQADTLMAYYELTIPEVETIYKSLGYQLPTGYFAKNLHYYLDRTTHGSTLSRIVYSVLDEMNNNMDQSWQLFSTALLSDYYDIQGGTTAEGIHLGVMGASLQIETRNYGGVNMNQDIVRINPHLPKHWTRLAFKQNFKGTWYQYEITQDQINVTTDNNSKVEILGKEYSTTSGKTLTVKY
ncbi:glycoside hydrolase family 65 protein [Lentilactobacillus laojiaonis]|uniref:glycoside hydrolase family 65 protein n=1 Tax=Lentilactobacillus laojiaonis TaxID=2883998 RepID=UPI001D0AA32F|nr:glycosyl hydrolase family 65 protein [Lentilactobacillus laojiaonis]UDM32547.1 glycoside hydrolase family 65 protein [Lentilactobacillus laojiaonis]